MNLERHDLRIARDAKLIERNDRARRAIRFGVEPSMIKRIFELSETAYEQLAGHVRGS